MKHKIITTFNIIGRAIVGSLILLFGLKTINTTITIILKKIPCYIGLFGSSLIITSGLLLFDQGFTGGSYISLKFALLGTALNMFSWTL